MKCRMCDWEAPKINPDGLDDDRSSISALMEHIEVAHPKVHEKATRRLLAVIFGDDEAETLPED
jgi:hypothetical protein